MPTPHNQPKPDLAAGSHAFVLEVSYDNATLELSKDRQEIGDGLELPPGDYVVFAKVDLVIWSSASQGTFSYDPPPPDVSANAQLQLVLGSAEDSAHVSLTDATSVEVRLVPEDNVGPSLPYGAVPSVNTQAALQQTASLMLGATIQPPATVIEPGHLYKEPVRLYGSGQAIRVTGARIVAIQLDQVTVRKWAGPPPKHHSGGWCRE
jgi:hypothetical protein